MPLRTISGNLIIPNSEPSAGGTYTDLTLELVIISSGITSIVQSSGVSTTNTYSFTFDDNGELFQVQLIRTSNDTLLSQSKLRGVLPRSFLLESEPIPFANFITTNWLFDAGLSILACSPHYSDLAKEITEGIIQAETSGHTLPFAAYHVYPKMNADAFYRTGTVSVVAYALGYYLEKNPSATNLNAVASVLNDLLIWLISKRDISTGLFIAGTGRYVSGVLDASYIDNTSYAVDNFLAYFAFKQAGRIINNALYQISDALADSIMNVLYDSATKKFYNGYSVSGITTSQNLEMNFMAGFFLIEENDLDKAEERIDAIEADFIFTDAVNNINGYKANSSDTKIWYEGSYAVAMLYYKLGDIDKHKTIITGLNKLLNDDGSFRYGVIKDGQLSVLDYKSVGSTAWSYISNTVPDEVFSVGTGDTINVTAVYFNTGTTINLYRNNCASGLTATLVTYTVYPGTYHSLISQADADSQAGDDIAANAQSYANAHGSCLAGYAYFNTLRNGMFISEQFCPGNNANSSQWPYSVSAHTFGSYISQEHAEALADAKMFRDGQLFSDIQSECEITTQVVDVTIVETTINNGSDDDIYGTIHASIPVSTFLSCTYQYSEDGGSTWNTVTGVTLNAGASNTVSFPIVSVVSGSTVLVRVSNVSPSTFIHQKYNWNNNVSGYTNSTRSAYFIKSGCTQVISTTVVGYSISGGTCFSYISQNYADALADRLLFLQGTAYANSNGICGNISSYPNQVQSGTFNKQGCPNGYSGSSVTYTVAPGTYISNISLAAANALAVSDVNANGQAYANTHGSCNLNANTILLSLKNAVDRFGLFDNVYTSGIAHPTGSVVHTGVTIDYAYKYHGVVTSGLTVNMLSGTTVSAIQFIVQVPSGEGLNVGTVITDITPDFDGTYYYVKE